MFRINFKPGSVNQTFLDASWEPPPPGRKVGRFRGHLIREAHCSVCRHCGYQTEFPSLRKMTDYIDFCRKCMHPICLKCVGKPCVTQEEWADELERQEYIKRQVERAHWHV